MNEGDASARPRFPYVASAFCAACVGVAMWLWMCYSYAWKVTPSSIHEGGPYARYVTVRGRAWAAVDLREGAVADNDSAMWGLWITDGARSVGVTLPRGGDVREHMNREGAFTGRVTAGNRTGEVVVDTAASRLTGESVAGLIVGAWGVFIFAAALLHWRKTRTAFHEEAAEAGA